MSAESLERFRREQAAAAVQRRKDRKLARLPVVVTGKRLRCPECRSVDLQTQRTLDSDQEILSQAKKCRTCGLPFTAILD